MFRQVSLTVFALAVAAAGWAQDRQQRIDVEHYTIDADINPGTQTLTANVQLRFTPVDDNVTAASFELNNALNVSKVVDGAGQQIPASRSHQDFSIRLNFPTPLPKGTPQTLTFTYDGRLSGSEESPVFGIKFASIQSEYSYLMYPSRWFPVSGYTTDRYTADIRIKAPEGLTVLGGGNFTQPSFYGSVALVSGSPITAAGVSTVYFRTEKDMATPYGEEAAKVLAHLSSVFGRPPYSSLTLVETDSGAPNGYSAPGILFLSPKGIGRQPNVRLLANQIARQWWGTLVSPASRNHIWVTNGPARYAELLYLEHTGGNPQSVEPDVKDMYVEALTVDVPPVIQAARLEDYSPEYWAVTGAKGAAVLHMLRSVIGDENFIKTLRAIPEQFAWKSISTEDFRKVAETAYGKDIGYFFIQWIESSGAPEFKMEYTVFRTQKGFRVMGKIMQDLDTFRMPVDLKIETEGNPEEQRVEVVGPSSEFVIETFGKPKRIEIDPAGRVLRFNNQVRVAVAIRRGEMFAEIGEFADALKEYQKALDVNRNSSIAHYRVAEVFFLQNNYQSAANEFREALNGDLEPKWVEVWSHINLGKIFDITGQRERATNEYQQAIRTKDNTQGAQEEAAKYLKQPYERQRASVQ
jgi:hypothetical protein